MDGRRKGNIHLSRFHFFNCCAVGRVDSSEERNNGLFHMAALCEEPVKLASRGKTSSERRDKAKRLSARRIREEGSGWEGVRATRANEKRKGRTRQPSRAGVLPVACVVCVFQDSGNEARQERAQILPELYKSTGWLQQADTMQLHNKNNLLKKNSFFKLHNLPND